MDDFHRKKDMNLRLNTMTQRDNSYILSDHSKSIYDFVLKHDTQIKLMEAEISNIKSQLVDITMKKSQNLKSINDSNLGERFNDSYLNQIMQLKDEIKNELMNDFNNIIISQKNEFKEKFDILKEEIELYNEEKSTNNKILEINDSLESLNQQLYIKNEGKNSLENVILNKINSNKNEIDNTTKNIMNRINSFDLDFDRLVQSLKNQFLTNANTISQLELSKVNINDYENQINLIHQNIQELKNKINKVNIKAKNLTEKNSSKNIFSRNNNNNFEFKNELNLFKNDLYNDLESINLKILNELSNQAEDIKTLYQKIQDIEDTRNQKIRDINFEAPKNITHKTLNLLGQNDISSDNINTVNLLSLMENELSKKANLDQLNFALETQSKLNDAFSSASRVCRFCWDTEGLLKDDKYIIWSIQNINTALDVFKWENNSESICILQNGIYKIVIGLIEIDKNKNFGIVFNNDENIIIDSRNYITNYRNNDLDNENDIGSDKGNIKFMEKYIACLENTNIKAILFDNTENNDNSEEAFLEIVKII
jgi:hypothetical protein